MSGEILYSSICQQAWLVIGMALETSIMSVSWALGWMTLFMTWYLPTYYLRNSDQSMHNRHIRVTQLMSNQSTVLAPLTELSKVGAWPKSLESHLRMVPLSTVQMRVSWNCCFKPLRFLSRIRPSPLCFRLGHYTSVPISCWSTFNRLTILVKDVCLFLFWIHGGQSANYAIQEHFCEGAVFQYDAPIWIQSSWKFPLVYCSGNHLRGFSFIESQQNVRPEGDTVKGPVVIENDTRKEGKYALVKRNSQGNVIEVDSSGGRNLLPERSFHGRIIKSKSRRKSLRRSSIKQSVQYF